jgi:D-lactate dehydrogenase (cytochrome)
MLKPFRSDSSMAEVAKNVKAITARHGGANFEFSKTNEEAQALWQGRKDALWSVMALKDDAKVWTTDVWCGILVPKK